MLPTQKLVGPEVVIPADGNGFTVMVISDEVIEHPIALITVTVKLPLLVTLIVCKVDPLLHK